MIKSNKTLFFFFFEMVDTKGCDGEFRLVNHISNRKGVSSSSTQL